MNENQLYEDLVKTYLLLSDGDRRFFSKFRMSQARFFALVSINNFPGISLTTLSDQLLCTKGNTTRILKGLEKDGFLVRELDNTDRRVFQLKLTELGQKILGQLLIAYQLFNQERFKSISIKEKEELMQLIQKLNRFLEKQIN